MRIPDMNTRSIKRIEGQFTIDPRNSQMPHGEMICSHCARAKCKVRNYIKRVPKDFANLRVQSCCEFVPALGFSVLNGLDLEYWNTFRIGKAWYDRLNLRPGIKVAVIDTVNQRVVCEAVVCEVHFGSMPEMLKDHAKFNHAILHEIKTGRTMEQDASSRLSRILKNAYGTRIASDDRMASVIYLRPQK